jgi:hypothetical protein
MTHPAAKLRLGTIFLCAALFRLLFLAWSWTPWLAQAQNPLSRIYFHQGYGLAAGYGYLASYGEGAPQMQALYHLMDAEALRATPQSAPPLSTAGVFYETLHPPGMAMLISALHRLLSMPADVPVQCVGLVMDALAAVLLCWVVSQALGPQIGYATSMVYAWFPPLAFASAASRCPEGLMSLFIMSCLACVWLAMQEGQCRWLQWCVLGGLALGVGSYLRPDYLLLPVALGAGAWAMTHRFWPSLRNALVVQLVALVALFPWAYRNHDLYGRWIFTSSSVGPVLITGLGEFRNPWGFGGLDQDRAREAAAQGFVSPWHPEADMYFRELFWKSIREQPVGYLETIMKRLPLALAPPLDAGFNNPWKQRTFSKKRQGGEGDRYDVFRSQFGHTVLAYADVLAMSGLCVLALLANVWMFWRERWRWGLCFFLLSPHLYSVGTHLLTHMAPRFLLPSIGCLLIGLGYVATLIAWWKSSPAEPRCNSSDRYAEIVA